MPAKIRLTAMLLATCAMPAVTAAATVPPRAVAIDTSASQTPAFGVPATPLHVPIRQLRVRFDQILAPMLGAGDAQGAAPDTFRVVAAGADGVLQTVGCGGSAAADDVDIALQAVQWSMGDLEASLTLGGSVALPMGRYRALACEGLLGVNGLALDGDGDGLPGGVASFDFVAVESPGLVNPTFESDVDHWQVNFGFASASHDGRDADGATHSGSLRVASDGVPRLLTSDSCAVVSGPAPLRYRARYRARVLSGTVRIRSIVWFGFSGDQGETWCEGPGVWTTMLDSGVRSAGGTFDLFDSGLLMPGLLMPGFLGPLATLKLQLISADGAPFEVLLDDIGLGLDYTLLFRASFE